MINKKVIFIDTEGGFSSERVKQILGREIEKENGENYAGVLKNILILKPTNFKEQKKVFDEFSKISNLVSPLIVSYDYKKGGALESRNLSIYEYAISDHLPVIFDLPFVSIPPGQY